MKKCYICFEEKKDNEFRSMAAYGCTCKELNFCTSCVLDWMSQFGVGGMERWSCPCCRGVTPTAVGRVGNDIVSELQLRDQHLLRMHEEWCREFTTPPFPQTLRFRFMFNLCISDNLDLGYGGLMVKHSMIIDQMGAEVYFYNGDYYCAAATLGLQHSFNKKKLLLPNDMIDPEMVSIIDLVKKQFSIDNVNQFIEMYAMECSLNDVELLHRVNLLRYATDLLEAIKYIRSLEKYQHATISTITRAFVDYVAQPTELSFVSHYLALS